ncbi:MAG: hypothetical protein ACRYGK_08470 [Janthinobacterium lividum]
MGQDQTELIGEIDAWVADIAGGNLRHLSISLDELPAASWVETIAAVTSASQWTTLEVNLCNLEAGELEGQAGAALRAINCTAGAERLTLNLNGTALSENDAGALLAFLRDRPQCKSLRISATPETTTALTALVYGLPDTGIDDVKLTGAFTNEQCSIFKELLNNPRLESFSCVGLSLDGDSLKSFNDLIARNTGLTSLMLARTNLSGDDTISLVQAIGAHATLESLHFSSTAMDASGWAALGEAIAASPGLSMIELPGVLQKRSPLAQEEALAFIKLLCTCTHLLSLDWRTLLLTKDTLPYLGKLLRNNPVMFRLGQIDVTDLDMARGLGTVLADIANPLDLHCKGNNEVRQHMAEVQSAHSAQGKPLLEMHWL